MALTTKNRNDLKSYFVKNAIPTQGNFAELIEAQLNQSDDGVFKLPGEPLSVVAASGEQRRVLRFYSSYPAANPDWLISLNPRDPSNPTKNQAGFGIADGAGNTRLFIHPGNGNLGVGTNDPQRRLDVNGDARAAGHMEVTGTVTAGSLRVNGVITPSTGNSETAGIKFPSDPFGGAANSAWIRYHNTRGDEKGTLEIGIANDTEDHIVLNSSGNVGIGLTDPQSKLDVAGSARVHGDMEVTGMVKANRIRGHNTLILDNYQTVNLASNVFLHAPPNDRDAWIYLDSAVTGGSNWGIYHRQINSAVAGLPPNSIGFIGGGQSKLQAYVGQQDGAGFFAGKLEVGGDVSIEGKLKSNSLIHVTGNSGVLNLEGTDHAYMQWYPMGASKGRKGWIGYGHTNAEGLSVVSEAGNLYLQGKTAIEAGNHIRGAGNLDIEGSAGLGWARGTADFNAPLRTGFYQWDNPTGRVPDTSHNWVHLIAVRHSNAGNHHQLQIASSYAENDKLYFRKIGRDLNDNNRPAWNEVATVAAMPKIRTGTAFAHQQLFENVLGERIVKISVSFGYQFATPPTVVVSLATLDTDHGANLRIAVGAEAITTTGCTIIFKTWADSIVYGVTATWMAIGV